MTTANLINDTGVHQIDLEEAATRHERLTTCAGSHSNPAGQSFQTRIGQWQRALLQGRQS